jgi:succinyl-diaminopimelate desuccinylase
MQDIENYKDKHVPPDFSFALDTAFPLYRGNKGVLRCNVKAKTKLKDILYLQGGDSANVTLGKIAGLLPYDKELYSWLKKRETERIRIGVKDEKIVLTAMGISKHSALPEGSLNAGWLLAELLKDCPFICEEDRTQMRVLSIVLLDIYGEKTGIATEDAEFGKLTCSNGIVKTEDGKIFFTLDIRFGGKRFVSQLENTLTSTFEQMDYEVEFLLGRNAHIIAEDNPYVQTCMDVYKEFTGDTLAKTRINAGGTYAMRLPCAVEIGTTTIWGAFKEMPNGHGGAHQPDECISIDGFLEAIELTALMVLACDKLSGKK